MPIPRLNVDVDTLRQAIAIGEFDGLVEQYLNEDSRREQDRLFTLLDRLFFENMYNETFRANAKKFADRVWSVGTNNRDLYEKITQAFPK